MHSSLNSHKLQIDFTQKLQELMQRLGISSFKSLSRAAGVSERQILRLRQGKVGQMRVDGLLKLSQALQISLSELVATFSVLSAEFRVLSTEEKQIDSESYTQHSTTDSVPTVEQEEPLNSELHTQHSALSTQHSALSTQHSALSTQHSALHTPHSALSTQHSALQPKHSTQELLQQVAHLQNEYQRLVLMLEQQREILSQEFQQSSWEILESLLLQWPTAAHKAQENPQLAAIKIVPLVQRPIEKLLQAWGVEAIAPVGAELPYDPQLHQLIEGNAQLGELVKVRYTGYCQGEKLLYRAKVSPM